MSAIDPQIIGVEDDGTDVGVVRAKIVRGDVVVMPFRQLEYTVEAVGAGTGSGDQEGLLTDSESGFGTGINLTVQAFATTGHGIRVNQPFYGPTFGVHFRRSSAVPDVISIGVDGMYWPVKGFHEFLTSRAISLTDGASLAVVVDNLPPVPRGRAHVGEIVVVNQPSGVTSVTVFGYLVDRSAGYSPPGRFLWPVTTTLTTSDVPVFKGTAAATKSRAVRKVVYYNADTVTRTILIKLGGTIIDKITLATLARDERDFGNLAATPTTLTQAAGEANTTNAIQATSWVGA